MHDWIKTITLGALASLGPLASQGSWAQSFPQDVSELVSRARAQVRMVDMARLKAALDQHSLGLIIDVREPAEFALGHIPGSINIPRGLIEFRIWPYVGYPSRLDQDQKITVYCGTGARAALAAKSLADLHFTHVTAADMQIEDWEKAGYPLERE